MKVIALTQGKIAFIDDEDYERVSQYKWFAYRCGDLWYAGSKQPSMTGLRVSMHRFIMGLDVNGGGEVDHKNNDGLDNRRENLRFATRTQNQYNKGKFVGVYTSSVKGVCWNKQNQKWQAYVKDPEGKQIHLGYFTDERDAISARREAESVHHGEFRWAS